MEPVSKPKIIDILKFLQKKRIQTSYEEISDFVKTHFLWNEKSLKSQIEYCVEYGIIYGYDNGKFKLSDTGKARVNA